MGVGCARSRVGWVTGGRRRKVRSVWSGWISPHCRCRPPARSLGDGHAVRHGKARQGNFQLHNVGSL